MRPLRLAVIGVGRVGQPSAGLIALSHDLTLGAFVRRPVCGAEGLRDHLRRIPLVNHVGQDLESLPSVEQEGRGVVLDRRVFSQRFGRQHFVLERRFDEAAVLPEVMLAAARAPADVDPGAYSLVDLPLSPVWSERTDKEE
ncbi:MAG: hypothetical protein H8K03_11020 [Nitrospira sp.]